VYSGNQIVAIFRSTLSSRLFLFPISHLAKTLPRILASFYCSSGTWRSTCLHVGYVGRPLLFAAQTAASNLLQCWLPILPATLEVELKRCVLYLTTVHLKRQDNSLYAPKSTVLAVAKKTCRAPNCKSSCKDELRINF
jgi:hypothetical protein